MTDLREALSERARAAGFHVENRDYGDDARLAIGYGSEEEEQSWLIVHPEAYEWILSTKFDRFVPLGEFDAVWSADDRVIECALNHGNLNAPAAWRLESMMRILGVTEGPVDRTTRIQVPSPFNSLEVFVHMNSEEIAVLRGLFRRQAAVRGPSSIRFPVLRLEGAPVSTLAEAESLLERLGNAVMFQLDLKSEVPLFPARRQGDGPSTLHAFSTTANLWRSIGMRERRSRFRCLGS